MTLSIKILMDRFAMASYLGIDFGSTGLRAALCRDDAVPALALSATGKLPWFSTGIEPVLNPDCGRAIPWIQFNNYKYMIDHAGRGATPQASQALAWATHCLTQMRIRAAEHFGEEISAAVLAVPSFWTDRSRSALKRAAESAGFTSLKLLEEGRAILMDSPPTVPVRNVLIFSMGAGSSSVSIYNYFPQIRPLAYEWDLQAGGDALDSALLHHFMAVSTPPYSLRNSSEEIFALKKESMRLKAAMASCSTEAFRFFDEKGMLLASVPISHSEFLKQISPLIERSLSLIPKALQTAGLSMEMVDAFLVAGGAAQLSSIRHGVQALFSRPVIFMDRSALARGAARYGSQLSARDADTAARPKARSLISQVPAVPQPSVQKQSPAPPLKPKVSHPQSSLQQMAGDAEQLVRENRFSEALAALERTMFELHAFMAHVCWRWSDEFVEKKEWDKALEIIEKGLSFRKDDPSLKRTFVEIYMARLNLLNHQGRYLDAKILLEKGLRFDPQCQEFRESWPVIMQKLQKQGISAAPGFARSGKKKKRK